MPSELLQSRQVAKDEVIFRQGEPGKEMYVVQTGKVAVVIHSEGQERIVATMGPGDIFGEMALIDEKPRTATVRALEDSTLLVVDNRNFQTMLRSNVEVTIKLINKLTERLRNLDQQLEQMFRHV